MTIQTDAIYLNGALQLKHPIPLAEGAEVRVAIETAVGENSALPLPLPSDPLAEVIGVGEGPAAGDVSRRHDDYLYGTP